MVVKKKKKEPAGILILFYTVSSFVKLIFFNINNVVSKNVLMRR